MSRGVYVALSGAVAQEHALETTATNLANAATPGYQRLRPVFREVLAGASKKENLRYAEVGGTAVDGTRGAVRATGRTLDVALPEGQYLAVATPRGERYTRAGALTLGQDGVLKTVSGTPLVREDGKPLQLSLEGGEPSINPDGSVAQNGEIVARLKIVKGAEGTTFSHEGGGLLAARGPTPTPTTTTLDVGALEDSNATAVTAMTDLVTASRTFEAFQRMLETFGECDRKVLTTTPGATE
ncbi:MAG: flagellar hook basal-body protein [Labilithrix sp.]|nr:flagellar hook basal-body protein [Labilithrix sp.]